MKKFKDIHLKEIKEENKKKSKLIKLKSKDYYTITKRTLSIAKKCCDGKIVSILEGGYDLNALKESTEEHVGALLEFD